MAGEEFDSTLGTEASDALARGGPVERAVELNLPEGKEALKLRINNSAADLRKYRQEIRDKISLTTDYGSRAGEYYDISLQAGGLLEVRERLQLSLSAAEGMEEYKLVLDNVKRWEARVAGIAAKIKRVDLMVEIDKAGPDERAITSGLKDVAVALSEIMPIKAEEGDQKHPENVNFANLRTYTEMLIDGHVDLDYRHTLRLYQDLSYFVKAISNFSYAGRGAEVKQRLGTLGRMLSRFDDYKGRVPTEAQMKRMLVELQILLPAYVERLGELKKVNEDARAIEAEPDRAETDAAYAEVVGAPDSLPETNTEATPDQIAEAQKKYGWARRFYKNLALINELAAPEELSESFLPTLPLSVEDTSKYSTARWFKTVRELQVYLDVWANVYDDEVPKELRLHTNLANGKEGYDGKFGVRTERLLKRIVELQEGDAMALANEKMWGEFLSRNPDLRVAANDEVDEDIVDKITGSPTEITSESVLAVLPQGLREKFKRERAELAKHKEREREQIEAQRRLTAPLYEVEPPKDLLEEMPGLRTDVFIVPPSGASGVTGLLRDSNNKDLVTRFAFGREVTRQTAEVESLEFDEKDRAEEKTEEVLISSSIDDIEKAKATLATRELVRESITEANLYESLDVDAYDISGLYMRVVTHVRPGEIDPEDPAGEKRLPDQMVAAGIDFYRPVFNRRGVMKRLVKVRRRLPLTEAGRHMLKRYRKEQREAAREERRKKRVAKKKRPSDKA